MAKKTKEIVGDCITQAELDSALELHNRFRVIDNQHKKLKQEWEAVEKKLVERRINGAMVEPGNLLFDLMNSERRNVPWKGVCEKNLGKAFCDKILDETVPDVTTHAFIMPVIVLTQKV
ncbi:MAG TPA: hypothetical protein VEF04_01685 [Blastocatellia bacterium]|nr:hypothetical protein [Blastocatellia bacterium]